MGGGSPASVDSVTGATETESMDVQHRHSQGSGKRKRKRGAAADAGAPSKHTLSKVEQTMRAARRRSESGRRVKSPRELHLEDVRGKERQPRRPRAVPIVYQATVERERVAHSRQQKAAEARRAVQRQAKAAALEHASPKLPVGRPKSTLDPVTARAVLAAIAAGTSFRSLEEQLKADTDQEGQPYPHTRQWLAARYKDGQLAEWAGQ